MPHKAPVTSSREDGRETKARIIEVAGPLFAQHGYDGTTSKEICQKAGVNMAAVNYHFGSRDGLYVAVLEEVQDYLVNVDVLKKLAQQEGSPRQKLERFVDYFIEDAFRRNDWHVRVWIQELLHPSPYIQNIISQRACPNSTYPQASCSRPWAMTRRISDFTVPTSASSRRSPWPSWPRTARSSRLCPSTIQRKNSSST